MHHCTTPHGVPTFIYLNSENRRQSGPGSARRWIPFPDLHAAPRAHDFLSAGRNMCNKQIIKIPRPGPFRNIPRPLPPPSPLLSRPTSSPALSAVTAGPLSLSPALSPAMALALVGLAGKYTGEARTGRRIRARHGMNEMTLGPSQAVPSAVPRALGLQRALRAQTWKDISGY